MSTQIPETRIPRESWPNPEELFPHARNVLNSMVHEKVVKMTPVRMRIEDVTVTTGLEASGEEDALGLFAIVSYAQQRIDHAIR